MATITITFTDPSGVERTFKDVATGKSLMELARANGIAGITADCGGACACATCHVYVESQWRNVVGEADDIESMTLDTVEDRRPESRLSCQIQLRDELDGLRVTVADA